MSDKTLAFLYLNLYCVLLFIVETLLVLFHSELESPKGTANVLFDYIALIAVIGYAHEKRMSSKFIWLLFAAAFFIWEICGYTYLDPYPFRIDAMMVIMLGPLYWGVIMYPLIIMEEDETKLAQMITKRDNLKERFKGLMVIICALALLFLFLSLTVMIRNL